jgi:glutamine amidotransferase
MSVAIIDYGMGNLASVQKALKKINIESVVTNNIDQISSSKYMILPGVGSFAKGMEHLENLSLVKTVQEQVLEHKKPFFGICLGMQLIAKTGTEPVETNGLGLIDGQVLKIDEPGLRVPHLGWNTLIAKKESFFSEYNDRDFYFIHSYHFKVSDIEKVAATISYGSEYVAAIEFENIHATQFHPEKSQTFGLAMLKKFFDKHAKG